MGSEIVCVDGVRMCACVDGVRMRACVDGVRMCACVDARKWEGKTEMYHALLN